MLISVVELIFNIIRNAAPVVFCTLFTKPRFDRKRSAISFLCALALTVAWVFISNNYFGFNKYIGITVFFVILFSYCAYCRDEKPILKILVPVIVFLIYLYTEMLFYVLIFLSRLCVSALQMFLRSGFIIPSIDNIINMTNHVLLLKNAFIAGAYLVFYYTAHRTREGGFTLKSKDIFAAFAFSAAVLLIAVAHIPFAFDIFGGMLVSTYILYFVAVILSAFIISAVLFFIMAKVSKGNETKRSNAYALREAEIYKEKIKHDSKYIEEIAAVKHNLKNKLLCISELIDENELERAKQMCSDAETELGDTFELFSSRNPYLNSILNVISKKARERQIDVKVTPQSDLELIDGSDLITVLGNLGDNAIEALSSLPEDIRLLRVSLLEKGGYYIVIVKNRIESSVLQKNPTLLSGKGDKLYHGHGLKTVRAIVQKYDGALEFSEEDGMFIVSAMIKIPNTTEK